MHSQAAPTVGLKGLVRTVFSSNDKRAMNQGFGDGMSRAFELVATPFVFAGIGWLIDRVAGTSPVFVLVLGAFGVVGTFLRFWYGYDAEMRTHESSGAWVPREQRTGTEAEASPDIWSARKERRA